MTFKQFDINLNRCKYIINKGGISVTKKKLFSVTERFVPFENVGSEIIRHRERKLAWLILSVLFFILTSAVFIKRISGANIGNGAEFFWLSVSIVFFIIYAFRRKNSLFLFKDDKTSGIEFIGTKIYERRLNQFIKELLHQREIYLSGKYPTFDGLTTDENINCVKAAIQPIDGLFLKKLTKHPLKKLTFETEYSKIDKPQGISSVTTEKNARKILKDHQVKFISEGKYIFISEFSDNEYHVGLVGTTSDPYKIMEYAETNGANYDIGTEDIIAKYKQWDKEFGIRPVSIGFDFCECEIENKDIDYKKLSADVYELCPDVVEQGTGTVKLLESEMKRTGRIFLWWD